MSEMWDSVADAWEANAEFVDGHLTEATRSMLDSAGIGEGDAVLDLACGVGGAGMAAAARVGPSGKVVLADDAPNMIAAADRRTAGLDHVSTLLCGQADVPLAAETFDAVFIRHGLMFAEEPAAAVKEALRVLKPGGAYVAMTWSRRSDNPWLGLVLDAVSEEIGAPFPPAGVSGPFALDDPEALGQLLEEGGLADVRVEAKPAPMSLDSVDAWWDLVPELAGPLAIALKGMEPPLRESIRERALVAGRVAAVDAPDGIAMNGAVLIASGSRN